MGYVEGVWNCFCSQPHLVGNPEQKMLTRDTKTTRAVSPTTLTQCDSNTYTQDSSIRKNTHTGDIYPLYLLPNVKN